MFPPEVMFIFERVFVYSIATPLPCSTPLLLCEIRNSNQNITPLPRGTKPAEGGLSLGKHITFLC